MKINAEQFEQFQTIDELRFFDQFMQHFREYWPVRYDATEREGAPQEFFDDFVARSRRLGFTRRNQIARYLDIYCVTKGNVDTDPRYAWAKGILESLIDPPDQRLAVVWDRLKQDVKTGAA